MQRVCVLGATGSVGTARSTSSPRHPRSLRGVRAHRATAASTSCSRSACAFGPRYAAVASAAEARALADRLRGAGVATEVMSGAGALCELAAHPEVDTVMAAIVGAAGLAPCLAAASAGKRLLLANKEALVVGGALFMRAVASGGATLLPIDSEHSAIHQCLPRRSRDLARPRRAHRPHRVGRSVPRPRPGDARAR